MKILLRSLLASLLLMSAAAAHGAPLLAGLLDGLPQVNVGASAHGGVNAARISPAQAAQRARKQYGGKVLSVDLEGSGQYRVKLIDKGNVRVVRVPAN